jgi:hypothetical protein
MPRRKKETTPEPQPTDAAPAGNGRRRGIPGVNMMECVRQALAQLGYDAKPMQIQKHLRRKFKLNMNPKMISTYKGSIVKEARQSGLIESPVARPLPAVVLSLGGDTVEEVRAVKELGDKLGADKVKALLELLYQ